jgi:hypothetical protein
MPKTTNEEIDALIALRAFLEEEEYEEGVCGSCNHHVGLAGGGVQLEPAESPIDGSAVLKVFLDRVEMWVCPNPWGHNNWRKHSTHTYTDKGQLKGYLDAKTGRKVNLNCWG